MRPYYTNSKMRSNCTRKKFDSSCGSYKCTYAKYGSRTITERHDPGAIYHFEDHWPSRGIIPTQRNLKSGSLPYGDNASSIMPLLK